MTAIRYFAYGSNMLTEWLCSRCPSARPSGIASAAGYKLAFSKKSKDGSAKAMLAAANDPAARVYGVLYDIPANELAALDASEGRGKGYERVEDFEVRSEPDGETILAVTYMADARSIDPALKPYHWYLDLAIKGAEQHALPDPYIDTLTSVSSVPDQTPEYETALNAFQILSSLPRRGIPLRSRANIRIAGKRTVGAWVLTRAKLTSANNPEVWIKAYSDFFMERLQSRYFAPIEALRKPEVHRKNSQEPWQGEGFAIVALQCSLIEFLGATLKGQTYVHHSELNRRQPTNYEYTRSDRMFIEFLTDYPPFKELFVTEDLALDFYKSVRCGLLHEARTRNGWTILAGKAPGPCIDTKNKIVYRNDLQNAFETFAAWYAVQLSRNKAYQAAFLRKFDDLCAD